MEVDKKNLMNLDSKVEGNKEVHEQNEEKTDKPEEDECCLYDEEGGFLCYIGKKAQGGWQQKGKGKGKGKFQGECYNCGKVGHRSRDCWSDKGKAKGKGGYKGYQQGKGDAQNGPGGWQQKGKGKGLNSFDNNAFAPQPQPLNSQHPNGPNRLMSTSFNGYTGNFGGLNLYSLETKNRFAPLISEDKVSIDDDKEENIKPKEFTIGDAMQDALNRVDNPKEGSQKHRKMHRRCSHRCSLCPGLGGPDLMRATTPEGSCGKPGLHDDGNVGLVIARNDTETLACLINQSMKIEAVCNLCTNIHDDYEKISVMVDSGASETVASHEKFLSYELVETTASGVTYSSAAESQAEDIIDVGEKFVETVDENGVTSWAKFQMCKGLGNGKILGSVSRLVQANHTVVFRDPRWGRYIENNTNGYRTYLRQENGSYYLDLWIKKVSTFQRQGS